MSTSPPAEGNVDNADTGSDVTTVDKYVKTAFTREQVEEMAENKTENGASSSVVTEDATFWIMTTVWPATV